MKKAIILFRRCFNLSDPEVQEEFEVAKKFFHVIETRTEVLEKRLVVGRYSVLPYYRELEHELRFCNSVLINSYEEHKYVADLTTYYTDIAKFTPTTNETWGHLNEGSWIVKGKTNSRKFNWNTHMFAKGREQLLRVIRNLLDDPFISEQGLVVREYVPLEQVGTAINGLPITKEWRCFFYKETLLCSGIYWTSHLELFNEPLPKDGIDFVRKVAKIIAPKCSFFVMDVAKKQNGGYIVIELNDAQMSGLSACDPNILYPNLKEALSKGK